MLSRAGGDQTDFDNGYLQIRLRQGKVCIQRREVFTEICVKDNGKGIPLERQAQIFQVR